MAPECVLYGKFSEASDVWSFGILCWEVFMFGQQPFAGLANEEVLGIVSEGKHPTPPDCPAHQLMLDCWEWSTKNRPTFNEESAVKKDCHARIGSWSSSPSPSMPSAMPSYTTPNAPSPSWRFMWRYFAGNSL